MISTQIIGNIGIDAVRESANGSDYLRFSVAINEKRGEVQNTTWITVFSRQLGLQQYLKSGTKVYVHGKPSLKSYFNQKLNANQVSLSLSANSIELLSSKNEAHKSPLSDASTSGDHEVTQAPDRHAAGKQTALHVTSDKAHL